MSGGRHTGDGDGAAAALREGYVVPLAGGPASAGEIDDHLAKAAESDTSATRDLEDGLLDRASVSGYDTGRHAIDALLSHRGLRINKDHPRGRDSHRARVDYLRSELRHARDLTTEVADDIATNFDTVREVRNRSYRPFRADRATAKHAVTTGRKVLRQVRTTLGRSIEGWSPLTRQLPRIEPDATSKGATAAFRREMAHSRKATPAGGSVVTPVS